MPSMMAIMDRGVHSGSELATSSPLSRRCAERVHGLVRSECGVTRSPRGRGRVQLALGMHVVQACKHLLGPHQHVGGEFAAFAVQELGFVALHALRPCCEVLGRLLIGRAGRGRRRRRGSQCWRGRRGQGDVGLPLSFSLHPHVQQDGPGDVALAVPGLVCRPTHCVAVDEGVRHCPDKDVLG